MTESQNGDWNLNAEQLLRPVTVRQMLDAIPAHTGANLAIDGNEFVHASGQTSLQQLRPDTDHFAY